MVWHELFPTHKHGCQKGGRDLKISAKMAVFLVLCGKIFTILTPLENLMKKSTSTPLDKILPTPMHTSLLHHYTILVKTLCCITPSGNILFNNTNALSKP